MEFTRPTEVEESKEETEQQQEQKNNEQDELAEFTRPTEVEESKEETEQQQEQKNNEQDELAEFERPSEIEEGTEETEQRQEQENAEKDRFGEFTEPVEAEESTEENEEHIEEPSVDEIEEQSEQLEQGEEQKEELETQEEALEEPQESMETSNVEEIQQSEQVEETPEEPEQSEQVEESEKADESSKENQEYTEEPNEEETVEEPEQLEQGEEQKEELEETKEPSEKQQESLEIPSPEKNEEDLEVQEEALEEPEEFKETSNVEEIQQSEQVEETPEEPDHSEEVDETEKADESSKENQEYTEEPNEEETVEEPEQLEQGEEQKEELEETKGPSEKQQELMETPSPEKNEEELEIQEEALEEPEEFEETDESSKENEEYTEEPNEEETVEEPEQLEQGEEQKEELEESKEPSAESGEPKEPPNDGGNEGDPEKLEQVEVVERPFELSNLHPENWEKLDQETRKSLLIDYQNALNEEIGVENPPQHRYTRSLDGRDTSYRPGTNTLFIDQSNLENIDQLVYDIGRETFKAYQEQEIYKYVKGEPCDPLAAEWDATGIFGNKLTEITEGYREKAYEKDAAAFGVGKLVEIYGSDEQSEMDPKSSIEVQENISERIGSEAEIPPLETEERPHESLEGSREKGEESPTISEMEQKEPDKDGKPFEENNDSEDKEKIKAVLETIKESLDRRVEAGEGNNLKEMFQNGIEAQIEAAKQGPKALWEHNKREFSEEIRNLKEDGVKLAERLIENNDTLKAIKEVHEERQEQREAAGEGRTWKEMFANGIEAQIEAAKQGPKALWEHNKREFSEEIRNLKEDGVKLAERLIENNDTLKAIKEVHEERQEQREAAGEGRTWKEMFANGIEAQIEAAKQGPKALWEHNKREFSEEIRNLREDGVKLAERLIENNDTLKAIKEVHEERQEQREAAGEGRTWKEMFANGIEAQIEVAKQGPKALWEHNKREFSEEIRNLKEDGVKLAERLIENNDTLKAIKEVHEERQEQREAAGEGQTWKEMLENGIEAQIEAAKQGPKVWWEHNKREFSKEIQNLKEDGVELAERLIENNDTLKAFKEVHEDRQEQREAAGEGRTFMEMFENGIEAQIEAAKQGPKVWWEYNKKEFKKEIDHLYEDGKKLAIKYYNLEDERESREDDRRNEDTSSTSFFDQAVRDQESIQMEDSQELIARLRDELYPEDRALRTMKEVKDEVMTDARDTVVDSLFRSAAIGNS